MALDVAAVREGLAYVVTAGTGLRMSAWQPDQLNPPCGWVDPGDPFMPEPHESMKHGHARIQLVVRVVAASGAGMAKALKELDPYMGSGTGQSKSVIDAIYDDTTLNGAVSINNVKALEVGGPRQIEVGGVFHIGFDVPLTVLVTRT